MAVYVCDKITPVVEKVPTQGSETIVIKLKKINLQATKLTFLSFFPIVYLPIASTQQGPNVNPAQTWNKR